MYVNVGVHNPYVHYNGSGYTSDYNGWLDNVFETPGTCIDALFAAYAMTKGLGTVEEPVCTELMFPDLMRLELGPYLVFIYKSSVENKAMFYYDGHGFGQSELFASVGNAIDATYKRYFELSKAGLSTLQLHDISEFAYEEVPESRD